MLFPVIQDISDGEEGDVITIYVGARNESTDSALADNIEFRIDDEPYDEDPDNIPATYEPIPAGESRFVGTVEWYSEEGEAGTHDITLRTTNFENEVTEQFTLGDATTFEADIEDVRGIEIYEGGENTVEVDWWVENNTGSGGSTDITLNVDGTQEDIEENVEFADSQERTGTLTWDAEGASIGEHDIEVTTTDDSAGQTFVVEEEEIVEADVVITGDTEEVRAGTDAEIEYTATNRTGRESGVKDVWLVVNGTEMDRDEDVSLDPGDQQTGTLIWPTTNDDVGDTEVTVNVGSTSGIDDEIEGQDMNTITVLNPDPDPQFVTDGFITMSSRDVQGSTTWDSEDSWNQYDEKQNIEITSEGTIRLAPPPAPSFFDVYLASAIGSPEAGEEMNIGYGVRNTGDETDTTDIWLEVDGTEEDRISDVELGENESDTGDLIWQTEIGDGGEHTATVRTDDDSQSVDLEVEPYETPEYGSNLYISGSGDDEVNEYSVSETFDVTTASHSSMLDIFDEESNATGMSWSANGTKMYIVGSGGEEVNQYDVSTPFDITTASHESTLDVSGEESSPYGMSWNDDGSKLYVVGGGGDVNEYTVSTAFDITTASHSSTFGVSGEASSPTGMSWNADGSKMYVVGISSESVHEYSVSTAFDVTTASHSSTFDVSGEESSAFGMSWNVDGSKMYVVGNGSDAIQEYDVSTPFDITTASHSSMFDVSGEEPTPYGISWNGAPQHQ